MNSSCNDSMSDNTMPACCCLMKSDETENEVYNTCLFSFYYIGSSLVPFVSVISRSRIETFTGRTGSPELDLHFRFIHTIVLVHVLCR